MSAWRTGTKICSAIAIVAWGSIVWLFCNSLYFQYTNGYLATASLPHVGAGTVMLMAIWFFGPVIGLGLSILLPLWLNRRGRTEAAGNAAIVLCALGLAWAALMWIGLGAG